MTLIMYIMFILGAVFCFIAGCFLFSEYDEYKNTCLATFLMACIFISIGAAIYSSKHPEVPSVFRNNMSDDEKVIINDNNGNIEIELSDGKRIIIEER